MINITTLHLAELSVPLMTFSFLQIHTLQKKTRSPRASLASSLLSLEHKLKADVINLFFFVSHPPHLRNYWHLERALRQRYPRPDHHLLPKGLHIRSNSHSSTT